jgi:hypothetical protein
LLNNKVSSKNKLQPFFRLFWQSPRSEFKRQLQRPRYH